MDHGADMVAIFTEDDTRTVYKMKDDKPLSAGKKDNFFGDRSVVMSFKQMQNIIANDRISDMYISDIGFYPSAKHHFRQRQKGISENILIYCIDGYGFITCKGAEHQLCANSCFIIPSNEPHSYHASGKDPWSIYWLHFGGKKSLRFEHFFGKVITLNPSKRPRTNDRINLFNEMITVLESGFSNNIIEYANLSLNGLLASFFYGETYVAAKGYQCSNPVDKAIVYMQRNINKCLKNKDIADHVQLSESHFSKIFRNKTGSSPINFFINMKMQEAIKLLSNRPMRIKEVAFTLGYEDPLYFSRCFTKQMGLSPGTFLKTSKRI